MSSDYDSACVHLVIFFCALTGGPCLYFGYKCKNAELRAEHTGVCKDIHNDGSAVALIVFGWIFMVPMLIPIGFLLYWLCVICWPGLALLIASCICGENSAPTVPV